MVKNEDILNIIDNIKDMHYSDIVLDVHDLIFKHIDVDVLQNTDLDTLEELSTSISYNDDAIFASMGRVRSSIRTTMPKKLDYSYI